MRVRLTTERLVLREFTAEDVEAVHRYAADPEVTRHMLWGPNSRQESQDFLQAALESQAAASRTDYTLGVIRRDNAEVIGAIHLGVLTGRAVRGRADLGYVLARDTWGQGYATEAVKALMRWAFVELGLHRVEASCGVDNPASRRVLEKVGLHYEGTRRDDYWVRGTWRTSHLFGLVRDGSSP